MAAESERRIGGRQWESNPLKQYLEAFLYVSMPLLSLLRRLTL